MEIIHFDNQADRLAYLKGKFTELELKERPRKQKKGKKKDDTETK